MADQGVLIRQLQGLLGGGSELRAFSVAISAGVASVLAKTSNADVSVSRTAVGKYTVTWDRPWANSSYIVVGSCFFGGSGIASWSLNNAVTYNASQFGCATVDGGAFTDLTWMCIAVGPT